MDQRNEDYNTKVRGECPGIDCGHMPWDGIQTGWWQSTALAMLLQKQSQNVSALELF